MAENVFPFFILVSFAEESLTPIGIGEAVGQSCVSFIAVEPT
jgi:hypothetical protein